MPNHGGFLSIFVDKSKVCLVLNMNSETFNVSANQ